MTTRRTSFALSAILAAITPSVAHGESYREADSGENPENTDDLLARGEGDDTPPPEAGGLKPPGGEMDDTQANGGMSKELERSDQVDSGRGLEYFWLSADVGIAYFDLGAGARGKMLPGLSESGAGLSYGGGLGVRILYLTAGARFRLANLSDYDAFTLGLELGMKIPLGALEPFVRIGAGYLGAFRAQALGQSLSVSGFSSRLSGGLDYYFSDTFSLGAELGLDVAMASRAALSGVPSSAPSALAERVGSVALGCELMMNVGFHL